MAERQRWRKSAGKYLTVNEEMVSAGADSLRPQSAAVTLRLSL